MNTTKQWKCRKCGLRIPKALRYPVHCACGYIDHGNGPGDRVAEALAAIGITPAVWASYRIIGGGMTARLEYVPPADRKCGCKRRQEFLNALHAPPIQMRIARGVEIFRRKVLSARDAMIRPRQRVGGGWLNSILSRLRRSRRSAAAASNDSR
jgi:hypothetical protein